MPNEQEEMNANKVLMDRFKALAKRAYAIVKLRERIIVLTEEVETSTIGGNEKCRTEKGNGE